MLKTVSKVIQTTIQHPKKHISKFKTTFSFEQRQAETQRIRIKYPDRIPVICERHISNESSPDIDKTKYLVPMDLTVGQFLFIIRKRLMVTSEQALYLFVNGSIPPTTESMINIYDYNKDIDGYLYMEYATEATFG